MTYLDDFDAEYYERHYNDLRGFDKTQLEAHWLDYGSKEGRHGSAKQAFETHPRRNLVSKSFDAADYLSSNPDLRHLRTNRYEVFLHFIENGFEERRAYKVSSHDGTFRDRYARVMSYGAATFVGAHSVYPKSYDQLLTINNLTVSHERLAIYFDSQYYFFANNLKSTGDLDSEHLRLFCLIHFLAIGIKDMISVREDLWFDVDFVRHMEPSSYPVRTAGIEPYLYYHSWIDALDQSTITAPNFLYFIKSNFGISWSDNVIDLPVYRALNTDLDQLADRDLAIHFLRHGVAEGRAGTEPNETNASLFCDLADHYVEVGKHDIADRIYYNILMRLPDFGRAAQHYADHLFRKKRPLEAFKLYSQCIDLGSDNKWTYINASHCLENLGNLSGALDLISRAEAKYPGEELCRSLKYKLREKLFWHEYRCAIVEGERGDIESCQQRIEIASRRCCDSIESDCPDIRPIKRVGMYANLDLPQCSLYRVEQKVEQLHALGLHVALFDASTDQTSFLEQIPSFDAVIFYRVAAIPSVIRCLDAVRHAGITSFYDIDDLIFDAKIYPEPIETYSGSVSMSEYVSLCAGVPLFRQAAMMCDVGITSTPTLAHHLKSLVRRREVILLRNGLGSKHLFAMETFRKKKRQSEKVCIFYGSGTKAHKLDLENILMPAFRRLNEVCGGKFRIVLVAHLTHTRFQEEGLPIDVCDPNLKVGDYWSLLSEADINIAVLAKNSVTDAKSEIKWIEAAMFRIPSIVSATATFSEVIDDFVDGVLCFSSDDFYNALVKLVDDVSLRRSIGESAYEKVTSFYNAESLSQDLSKFLTKDRTPFKVRSKRIMVVNVFFPPQAIGGATRVVSDNIDDMKNAFGDEFHFEVFTTIEGGASPYETRVFHSKGIKTTAIVTTMPDQEAIDERVGVIFARCVERFCPDLIHFHCIQRMTASVVEVALRREIPYIITMHDGWWISDKQFLFDGNSLAKLYDYETPFDSSSLKEHRSHSRILKLRPMLFGSKAVLSVSDRFADILRAAKVPNVSVNTNGLSRAGLGFARRNVRRDGDLVRLAHLGGLEIHKGYQLLMLAVKMKVRKNIEIIVVDHAMQFGDHRYERWNGAPVEFVGKCPQEHVAALYSEIDVLFAPSLWPESFGLVSREALAAGCWVVASDRGAIGDPIVEGENGHIISVDDISGLERIVSFIDDNPSIYRQSPHIKYNGRSSADQGFDLATRYREVMSRQE